MDWEIYSSMFDGKVNKQSGILVINLPSIGSTILAAHGEYGKKKIYPAISSWKPIASRTEYEKRYPYMPIRIIDNLLNAGVKISVTNWDDIKDDVSKLSFLIDVTFDDRAGYACDYV